MNPVCPYCRTEIGAEDENRVDCPGCATPHHADCFQENGGCTVFGCSHAPVDEPKISLSGSDLAPHAPPVPSLPPRSSFSSPSVLGTGLFTPAPAVPAPAPAASAAPPPPPPIACGTGAAPPPPPRAVGGFASPASPAPSSLVNYYRVEKPKTRVAFVLLGIFLGMFGVHNFYAGYYQRGAWQLCITLLTCFYGTIVSWLWAIGEIILINQDADGASFV